MGKIYEFTVEGPEETLNADSIIQSLINQANDETRQKELSKKINKRVMAEHRQILLDFADEFVVAFKKLGFNVELGDVGQGAVKNLEYTPQCVSIILRNEKLERLSYLSVGIHGIKYKEGEFADSQYLTYSGKYRFNYVWDGSACYKDSDKSVINSVEDFLESERARLVKEIKNIK